MIQSSEEMITTFDRKISRRSFWPVYGNDLGWRHGI